jgi:hypothetical protein
MSPVLVALGAVVLVGTTVVVLAAWVDDVLFAPVRRVAAVARGRGRPGGDGPGAGAGGGARPGGHPVILRFTTHDRCEVEVAVAHQDAGLLVGPFLTAAMSGLPEAPRERGT